MALLNEIQGGIVLTQFADVTGVPVWKTLVCEQDASFTNGMDITEEPTKCGTAVALSDPTWSASGTAVANSAPAAGFVSYRDMQAWMNNKVRRRIRVQSAADPALSLDEGEAFYHEGEGYVTDVSFNYGNGAIVKFDWTFSGQGNLKTSNLAVGTQPTNQSVAAGASASFTVAATGGIAPLTYQWYKDGVAISGATAETYTDANAQEADEGSYHAVITDAEGNESESDTATLTVT
jgi:hypothetical protein